MDLVLPLPSHSMLSATVGRLSFFFTMMLVTLVKIAKSLIINEVCAYTILDYPPKMTELRSFNTKHRSNIDFVVDIGATDYRKFGTLILEDEKPTTNIQQNCFYQVECIVHEILAQWLKGNGLLPVTWDTLVTVLKKIGLKILASNIISQSIRSRDEP